MLGSVGVFFARISIYACMILGGLITSIYYANWYNDGQKIEKAIVKTKKSIEQQKVKKKTTEKLLAEQEQLKQEVGLLAGQFKEISSQLPITLKTQEIIDTINQLAKNAGCYVVSLRPERTLVRDLYEEIPIRVQMTGGFSNLLMFMYYISTLERVTNLDGLSLVNETDNYTGTLKLNTTIVSFKYRPPVLNEKTKKKLKNKKTQKVKK